MSTSKLPRHLSRLAELAYRSLNTPRSLTAYLLLRYGEWDQLANLRSDPTAYLDTTSGIEKYRRDAQASDLLRKFDGLPTPKNSRVKRAVDAFHAAEERCLVTNEFLLCLRDGPFGDYERACAEILCKARKWIKRVLGDVPPSLDGRYGPGTTFELKGLGSTLADKFWSTTAITHSCQQIFEHCWASTHVARTRCELGLPWVNHVRGNRFSTVDKDSWTDRGICIEPGGNLFCQLGIGGYFKERLASIGIEVGKQPDLTPLEALRTRNRPEGQTIHRELARKGSIDGDLVTIDLRSASDTNCYQLVRDLLPDDWFQLCSAVRSPFTYINGKWHHLQKFSSMGNGYTFELETLVFCALIHAVTGLTPGEDVFVYGDDIIVPSACANDTLAVLQAFGFEPNPRKTFVTGSFRESCGGDYFQGVDVRPFYLKEDYVHPCEWYVVYNELMRRGLLNAARVVLYDIIPIEERWFGPSRLGHTVLHSPDINLWKASFGRYKGDYETGRHRGESDGILWVRGRVLAPIVIEHDRWGSEMLLSLALYGVRPDGLSPRGEIRGSRTIRLSVT